jgi:DNA-binding Lrp family transcriptional regulator
LIRISKAQKDVADFIGANPDCLYGDIWRGMPAGFKEPNLGPILSELIRKGIVSREGRVKSYRYILTGSAYTDVREAKEPGDELDPLLESIAKASLTPEQIKLYKENRKLPRRQLAKLLGISKLELNQALDKMRPAGSWRV